MSIIALAPLDRQVEAHRLVILRIALHVPPEFVCGESWSLFGSTTTTVVVVFGSPPPPTASHSLQNQDRIDDGDQEENVDGGGRKKRTPRSESDAVQDGEFVIPVLGEARNAHMEESPRMRSPRKQQMAAEGVVTRNRSKKNVGAAVVPTSQRRSESKDNLCAGGGGTANKNKVVRDGMGGGNDKGAKGVVATKDKRVHARAKDVGGNAAMDK